jgi:hypothetical protein
MCNINRLARFLRASCNNMTRYWRQSRHHSFRTHRNSRNSLCVTNALLRESPSAQVATTEGGARTVQMELDPEELQGLLREWAVTYRGGGSPLHPL